MIEKYCDINYRDYLLEIEERKYPNGNSLFSGRCREGIRFFAGWFYDVVIVISKFEKAIDDYITDNSRDKANTNKEEDLLFTVYYKDHKLEIEDKDTVSGESKYYYFGYSNDPSFWTWKKTDYISIIEAFRKKVDDKLAGIVEEPADYGLSYKEHVLTIRKKGELYFATSTVHGRDWKHQSYSKEFLINWFKTDVDEFSSNEVVEERSMKEQTYQDVRNQWDGDIKTVTYKNRDIKIEVYPQGKDGRAFFVGYANIYPRHSYLKDSKSFESIHYDKVVSKFEKWVDEYCTDWVVKAVLQYKGYEIKISREVGRKDFYMGTVQFHKNSTFKHIADTREEVERCCKDRIGKVIYEKEKVSKFTQDFNRVGSVLANGARKLKIQELEQLQARISAQLEELKKEKDILTYKGIVLELVDDPVYKKGILKGVDNPSAFVENSWGDLNKSFESYVDRLESQYNLYRKLTGKEE